MAKNRRKGLFRQMFNVGGWMGVQNLKETGDNIVKNFKDLSETNTVSRVETFEEAMQRLGMNEESLERRKKQCYYTGWFYVACSLILFLYGTYLIAIGGYVAGLISWILSVFAGALAYRESFWYFQMSVRKLGCSFKEYQSFLLGRKK
jgi:intracellular multiplication protein IcmV